ncbi:MAG TPA: ribonuclease catalytic domain-containing protein, partial [Candidatus Binataceae bacterium]|nr:ribonuclease catalytic domain-containing protein [Candidatus Binataceae bacterium]
MSASHKHLGSIIEFLDQGRFRAGLVIREQERHLAIIDADGRERLVARDLVMMHHPDRNPARELAQQAIAALAAERAELERELDLNLLWEVVQEQGRSFTASELAELFFGRRSTAAASVMLEKLLEDRVYFVRRHMDFVPRTPEQVDRLRLQQDRVRSRGDEYRHMQQLLRDVINQAAQPPPAEAQTLIARLSDYLENPFTRSREMTQLLESAAPEVDPAEAAFEILDRLGARPQVPRFAFIAGLRTEFSEAAVAEALATVPGPRALSDGGYAFTIDDEDTLEVDDALACEPLADGALRVRIHIALVSDLVARGGAIDQEAAARATTVYLPETTVWMLPERIACSLASLVAGEERPVLTTDTVLSATGELLSARIYPSRVRILQRLNYDEADRHLSGSDSAELAEPRASLRLLAEAARKLRQRRGRAGALLMHRREAKVRVSGSQIDIHVLDTDSPSRMLVGEFMVLSNYVAARYAAENQIPIIYRVQPDTRMDVVAQRPRLSLYPDFHAGIG